MSSDLLLDVIATRFSPTKQRSLFIATPNVRDLFLFSFHLIDKLLVGKMEEIGESIRHFLERKNPSRTENNSQNQYVRIDPASAESQHTV